MERGWNGVEGKNIIDSTQTKSCKQCEDGYMLYNIIICIEVSDVIVNFIATTPMINID